MPNDFISEDDLDTFEGWLRYQAVDPNTLDLSQWRSTYDEAIKNRSPAVGLMKVRRPPARTCMRWRYVIMAFGSSCGSDGHRMRSSP